LPHLLLLDAALDQWEERVGQVCSGSFSRQGTSSPDNGAGRGVSKGRREASWRSAAVALVAGLVSLEGDSAGRR
jgi:hypothetical protein